MSIEINVTNQVVEINETSEVVEIVTSGGIGPAGAGVASGGTTGQVLAKNSNANFDTEWVDSVSEILYNRFTVYGDNGSFYWQVTGARSNIIVEPHKNETNVRGNTDGPYLWIE